MTSKTSPKVEEHVGEEGNDAQESRPWCAARSGGWRRSTGYPVSVDWQVASTWLS